MQYAGRFKRPCSRPTRNSPSIPDYSWTYNAATGNMVPIRLQAAYSNIYGPGSLLRAQFAQCQCCLTATATFDISFEKRRCKTIALLLKFAVPPANTRGWQCDARFTVTLAEEIPCPYPGTKSVALHCSCHGTCARPMHELAAVALAASSTILARPRLTKFHPHSLRRSIFHRRPAGFACHTNAQNGNDYYALGKIAPTNPSIKLRFDVVQDAAAQVVNAIHAIRANRRAWTAFLSESMISTHRVSCRKTAIRLWRVLAKCTTAVNGRVRRL